MSIIPHPEVAAMLHEKRFTRFLTSFDMPRGGMWPGTRPWGWRRCKWCGAECKGRRRAWCSDDCKSEYWLRSSGSSVRLWLWDRDGGICAVCGIPAEEISELAGKCKRKYFGHGLKNRPGYSPSFYKAWGPWGMSCDNWYYSVSLWEADHIIPVIEGGGCCGLENYRTLCLRCHKEDTAALAARRANRTEHERLEAIETPPVGEPQMTLEGV